MSERASFFTGRNPGNRTRKQAVGNQPVGAAEDGMAEERPAASLYNSVGRQKGNADTGQKPAPVVSPEAESVPSLVRHALEVRISLPDLRQFIDEYLLDSEYRGLRPHTVTGNRSDLLHLVWFLEYRGHKSCGKAELKQFLLYLQQDHPEGRWKKPWTGSSPTKALRPVTVRSYHRCIATFFNWMVDEEIIPLSPMHRVKAPSVKKTQKEPLSNEQVKKLLDASRLSPSPVRDEAILLMLLDTGIRAAELCGLKVCDMDFKNRSAKIVGKGNKIRVVFWSIETARALSRYLRGQGKSDEWPVFTSDRGTLAGGKLTPSGLLQLMRRLERICGVKCGVHDWRRTCAVNLLRNGANIIAVQRLLGHESLCITQLYLNLAQSDIQNQHREFSPVEHLRRGRRR